MGWPGPMTHRQYVTWREWLDEQWNTPSRSDHYLMRIALRCHQAALHGTAAASKVTEDEQRVRFTKDSEQKQGEKPAIKGAVPLSAATITATQKSMWRLRMGEPVSSTPPLDKSS